MEGISAGSPFVFEYLFEDGHRIFLACSFREYDIDFFKKVKELSDGKFFIPEIGLWVFVEGFDKWGRPEKNSPFSSCQYWARVDRNNKGFLLQYLPAQASSSRHYHKVKTEKFIVIAGKCFISLDDSEDIHLRSQTIVEPEIKHQVKTKTEYAVNLIEITGGKTPTEIDDHYY